MKLEYVQAAPSGHYDQGFSHFEEYDLIIELESGKDRVRAQLIYSYLLLTVVIILGHQVAAHDEYKLLEYLEELDFHLSQLLDHF